MALDQWWHTVSDERAEGNREGGGKCIYDSFEQLMGFLSCDAFCEGWVVDTHYAR
jgi:hypothetical protein